MTGFCTGQSNKLNQPPVKFTMILSVMDKSASRSKGVSSLSGKILTFRKESSLIHINMFIMLSPLYSF